MYIEHHNKGKSRKCNCMYFENIRLYFEIFTFLRSVFQNNSQDLLAQTRIKPDFFDKNEFVGRLDTVTKKSWVLTFEETSPSKCRFKAYVNI